VNACNDDGETPLHTNVKSASYDFLRCLVDHGADVNAQDKSDRSVLHRALLEHSLPAIKLLLCDVTATPVADTTTAMAPELVADSQGDTLLHKLSRSEEFAPDCLPRVIKALTRHGDADTAIAWNRQNGQGSTCLHVALRQQNAAAVQILLAQSGVDIEGVRDQEGQSALDLILSEMDLSTLLALVERRGMSWMDDRVKRAILDARDQDSGHSLLHKAVTSGSLEGTPCSSACVP
jgi:ankyrin repeat protein